MALRVFTAEFMTGRKPVVRGFTQKTAAVAWAKERVADDSVSAISLWEMTTSKAPSEALAIAAEGKDWYESRSCFLVIARNGVRVSK